MINPYKKVLDSVAYKGEARPILQCVHYEKGNAYATDSHQLVKFSGVISDDTLEQNINLLTDLPDFGNYPDVTRLFSDDFLGKISFENYDSTNNSFKELVKFLKSAKNQNITLKISDKMCILSTGETQFNLKDIKISTTLTLNDFSIIFNAKYLFNALNQIPNFSKKENYKGDIDIEFKDDPLRPFQVHFDKMTFVICPVRTY